MRMLRTLLVSGSFLLASAVSALAIQPGTTGTEKRFQEQGLRSGVLIQKNNTATAAAGAATLNAAGSGVITSESLTTLAGSDYTLTLTNTMVSAGDVVHASVDRASATTGSPYIRTVTPADGSVVIIVRNGTPAIDAALNGTLKIRFSVIKQTPNGAD